MAANDPSSPEYWRARWAEGRTGWHREDVNPAVLKYQDTWLPRAGMRVLVPLCGKTLDMAHLAGEGHKVVGVEASEPAARAFFEEREMEVKEEERGPFLRLSAGAVEILVGDFFAVTSAEVGVVDAALDRGSLVALPAAVRPRYAATMAALLPAGARVLLMTVAYDQSLMDGPPFSASHQDIDRLFAEAFEVERLAVDPHGSAPGRFAEAGLKTTEDSVTLLVRR